MEQNLFYALIFLSMVIVTSVALILYVEVFSAMLTGVVIDTTKSYSPTDVMRVGYHGHRISRFALSVSLDGGKVFTSINSSVTSMPYSWTIPQNIYSHKVVIRVADASKPTTRFMDSSPFAVVPHFDLSSDILTPGASVLVPGVVTIKYTTNSTLITSQNMVLTVSTDGTTWTAPHLDCTYLVDTAHNKVIWNLTNSMLNLKTYIKLSTTDLKSRGFEQELSVQTPSLVNFVSSNGKTSSTVGGDPKFDALIVRTSAGTTDAFIAGKGVYLQYTLTSGIVDNTKLQWSYKPAGSPDWTPANQLLNNAGPWQAPLAPADGSSTFSWVLPPGLDGDTLLQASEGSSVVQAKFFVGIYMKVNTGGSTGPSYMNGMYQIGVNIDGTITNDELINTTNKWNLVWPASVDQKLSYTFSVGDSGFVNSNFMVLSFEGSQVTKSVWPKVQLIKNGVTSTSI